MPPPFGSAPGYRRPAVVVQGDDFNRSRIGTVCLVIMSSNLALLRAPANVPVPPSESGLPKESVANVSQIVTLDRHQCSDPVGLLSAATMRAIDHGLRMVLGLG